MRVAPRPSGPRRLSISGMVNNLQFGPLNYENTPQQNVRKNQEIKQLDEEGAAAPGQEAGPVRSEDSGSSEAPLQDLSVRSFEVPTWLPA